MDDFQPEPHTPGRVQTLFIGDIISVTITDTQTPNCFDMEAAYIYRPDYPPYAVVYGVDTETLFMVLEMLPASIERLKAEAASELSNN